eukprot:6200334-Pleurochrysis_carterae.AAC.3
MLRRLCFALASVPVSANIPAVRQFARRYESRKGLVRALLSAGEPFERRKCAFLDIRLPRMADRLLRKHVTRLRTSADERFCVLLGAINDEHARDAHVTPPRVRVTHAEMYIFVCFVCCVCFAFVCACAPARVFGVLLKVCGGRNETYTVGAGSCRLGARVAGELCPSMSYDDGAI